MLPSITTAADLLAHLRAEAPAPALCNALADRLYSHIGDGPVFTPPSEVESETDLVALALAALLNDGSMRCWEVGGLTGESEWDDLYSAGAYALADRGAVELPGGVRVRVSPILEIGDLYALSTEAEHLLVHLSSGAADLTFAHTDAVTLPRELREQPETPDYTLPREEFDEAEADFYATLAARGVMAGVLQFLRGVELSAEPLLSLIRTGEWRVVA